MIKQFIFFVSSIMSFPLSVILGVACLLNFLNVFLLRSDIEKIKEDLYLISNPECPHYEGIPVQKKQRLK